MIIFLKHDLKLRRSVATKKTFRQCVVLAKCLFGDFRKWFPAKCRAPDLTILVKIRDNLKICFARKLLALMYYYQVGHSMFTPFLINSSSGVILGIVIE